jgi:uncharacterized membrane protein YesL
VRDSFDEFLLLAACNFIWAVCSMPLLGLALFAQQSGSGVIAALVAMTAVIPLGPASVGLAALAQRVSEGRTISFGVFFGAMRQHARPAWLVMGLWMLGMVIILVDIAFYAQVDNLFGAVLYGLWIYLLVIWVALLIYLFPLIILQEQPNLRLLARNALVMTLGRPLFTLTTLVLMSIIVVLSYVVVVPLFIVTFSLLAVWGMRATTALIEDDKARRASADPQAAPADRVEEKGRRGQVRPK